MRTLNAVAHLYEGDRFPEGLEHTYPGLRDGLLRTGVLRPDKEGRAVIRFVGVAIQDAVTVVMLPKVRVAARPDHVQRQTVRAMRTYARSAPSHHEMSPYLNSDPDRGLVSGIAICDWLMRDFWAHGLYRRSVIDLELNGSGRTHWAATIALRQPIFSRGRPIYTDTVTRRSDNDASNFATMLHLHLLEVLSAEFAALLDCEPIVLDHEPVDRFDILPDADECERLLATEMRNVYADRSLNLLHMLITAMRTREIERSQGLSLYGTGSFHNVWECACAHVAGNEVEAWCSALPKPSWVSECGKVQEADTLRPDVVTPLNPDTLLIADAKYYRPVMPPALAGVPGVNDIAKQVWYRQYLEAPAKERGYRETENIFLFPGSEGPLVSRIGSVDFPAGKETIQAINLNFLLALQAYSDGSDRLRTIFVNGLRAALGLLDSGEDVPVEQCENIS